LIYHRKSDENNILTNLFPLSICKNQKKEDKRIISLKKKDWYLKKKTPSKNLFYFFLIAFKDTKHE